MQRYYWQECDLWIASTKKVNEWHPKQGAGAKVCNRMPCGLVAWAKHAPDKFCMPVAMQREGEADPELGWDPEGVGAVGAGESGGGGGGGSQEVPGGSLRAAYCGLAQGSEAEGGDEDGDHSTLVSASEGETEGEGDSEYMDEEKGDEGADASLLDYGEEGEEEGEDEGEEVEDDMEG